MSVYLIVIGVDLAILAGIVLAIIQKARQPRKEISHGGANITVGADVSVPAANDLRAERAQRHAAARARARVAEMHILRTADGGVADPHSESGTWLLDTEAEHPAFHADVITAQERLSGHRQWKRRT